MQVQAGTQYCIISELNGVGDTDLCDAGVRHDRDSASEETKIPSRPDAPPDCSDCLCRYCLCLNWALQSKFWKTAYQMGLSPWTNKTDEMPTVPCSVHNVHSHHLPFLWWTAQFLWWICLRTDYLFRKLPLVDSPLFLLKMMVCFDLRTVRSLRAEHFLLVYFWQLPCIMWLAIYKPKRFSLSWFTNWVRTTDGPTSRVSAA